MKILNSEDLFIFNLLTPEESSQLIEFLKLYAEMCADSHDPEFILLIEDERIRSAFTYFNNRFARRRPKKKPCAKESICETTAEVVKSPSPEASAEISAAISDSRISFMEALSVHCPAIAARFKPRNKEYNLLRDRPAAAAEILIDLERSGFTGSVGRQLLARLAVEAELKSSGEAATNADTTTSALFSCSLREE